MTTLAADVRPAKIKRAQTDLSNTTGRATPLSRRAAMTAFAAGTAAVAIRPAAALASKPGNAADVDPELAALIAAYWATDAVIDRFYDQVFNPACERQHERYNAVPHVVQPITPLDGDTRERKWSTANRLDVACVAGIVKLSRTPAILSQEPAAIFRRREARSFWAAHLRRERELERINQDPEVEAASATERRLDGAQIEREDAIVRFRCRSLADLHAKVTFAATLDHVDASLPELIAADTARIIGGEA